MENVTKLLIFLSVIAYLDHIDASTPLKPLPEQDPKSKIDSMESRGLSLMLHIAKAATFCQLPEFAEELQAVDCVNRMTEYYRDTDYDENSTGIEYLHQCRTLQLNMEVSIKFLEFMKRHQCNMDKATLFLSESFLEEYYDVERNSKLDNWIDNNVFINCEQQDKFEYIPSIRLGSLITSIRHFQTADIIQTLTSLKILSEEVGVDIIKSGNKCSIVELLYFPEIFISNRHRNLEDEGVEEEDALDQYYKSIYYICLHSNNKKETWSSQQLEDILHEKHSIEGFSNDIKENFLINAINVFNMLRPSTHPFKWNINQLMSAASRLNDPFYGFKPFVIYAMKKELPYETEINIIDSLPRELRSDLDCSQLINDIRDEYQTDSLAYLHIQSLIVLTQRTGNYSCRAFKKGINFLRYNDQTYFHTDRFELANIARMKYPTVDLLDLIKVGQLYKQMKEDTNTVDLPSRGETKNDILKRFIDDYSIILHKINIEFVSDIEPLHKELEKRKLEAFENWFNGEITDDINEEEQAFTIKIDSQIKQYEKLHKIDVSKLNVYYFSRIEYLKTISANTKTIPKWILERLQIDNFDDSSEFTDSLEEGESYSEIDSTTESLLLN